jgi:predicted transcriptional regulator
VKETVVRSNQTSFPVVSDGEFMGIVGIRELQAQRERWPDLHVRDVMVPADRVKVVSADADASDAVNELADRDVDQVAVVENGHFLGVLRREDIVRWLAFHPTEASAH